jgi:hypothetical protein
MTCIKQRFVDKKTAKKAAKGASHSEFGGRSAKFSEYHCKDCVSWHIFTVNRKKLKHNSQHARGRGPARRKAKYRRGGRR